tara:strand:+ start:553 stop:783 length:231 start_codon:yes stop_codon:yes gene_type:complete
MFFTFFKNLFLSKKDKFLSEIRIYSEKLEESTGCYLKTIEDDGQLLIQIFDAYGDEYGDACDDLATVADVTGLEVI